MYEPTLNEDPFLFVTELDNLTDDQLWAIVQHYVSLLPDDRLANLVELGKRGRITADQAHEMEIIIDLADRITLLRSRALAILKQRGYEQQLRNLE